jgi:hypothetical protein
MAEALTNKEPAWDVPGPDGKPAKFSNPVVRWARNGRAKLCPSVALLRNRLSSGRR